jgi:hypothetical protein
LLVAQPAIVIVREELREDHGWSDAQCDEVLAEVEEWEAREARRREAMTDREQVRRSAEEVLSDGFYLPGEAEGGNPYIASHIALAKAALQLLAELEKGAPEEPS